MAKPVLLTVDDEREVLGAILRDLRKHYSKRFRVLSASSGAEALEALRELQRRGDAVALLLVDQRMPKMTGIGFLCEARVIYPEAVRVLLTAYADTQAAIAAINDVGLHQYLMKPWDPPEQKLYPVLDDLLEEWLVNHPPAFEGIRIVGSRWSPQSDPARAFLGRNHVPYKWLDLEQDASAKSLLASVAGDASRLPVLFFADGTSLIAPGNVELAEKAGLQATATQQFYDVVIIGGGPAGLANAVYAATEGLRALLIEQHAPGGQAGSSSMIENYLGFPSGVTGADLAQRAVAQARRFGAEMLVGQPVTGLKREDPYRVAVLAGGREVYSRSLVISTGMAVRELELPGVTPLVGRGIYYGAAMSEATLYRDQDVAILGGANSAGQAALLFSTYARTVTVIVRAESLITRMSNYLVERIGKTGNIHIQTGVELTEARGDGHLQQICMKNAVTGAPSTLDVAALFVFIGVAPHTEAFAGFVEMDAKGCILTGPDLPRPIRDWPLERDPMLFETSVPGVFAAGDVRSGANRRVAAAVGEGSAAIYSVQRYLETV